MTEPTMETGTFTIGEWVFTRYEPLNAEERHEVRIVARSGDKSIVRVVPLFHPNLFGLDIEDADAVDEAVEALIVELGLE